MLTRQEVIQRHAELIQDNRHVRFMWIPFADAVVVVSNNPTVDGVLGAEARATNRGMTWTIASSPSGRCCKT